MPGTSFGDERVGFTDGSSSTLATMRADGTDVVPIGQASGFDPAWAPGGGRVAYSTAKGGVFATVYTVPLSGSCPKPVTPSSYNPTWSPDGTHLAYTVDTGGFSDRSGPREVHVFDTLTGQDRSLGPGLGPAWSPDGSTIAFYSGSLEFEGGSLALMNADGSNRRQLPFDLADAPPRWSPDGARLAFVTTVNGARTLETARAADGGDPVVVVTDAHATRPTWTLDGREILFSIDDPQQFVIKAVRADGSGGERTVSPAGTKQTGPSIGNRAAPTADGYFLLGGAGRVFDFGNTCRMAFSAGAPSHAVGFAVTPSGAGGWTTSADGGVFTAGDAGFFGSLGGQRLNRPIVGMAATSTGRGYWLVASDGGVFSFGDASFFGSTGGIRLNRPIVGMAPTPTGGGYWLVASDGGVFTFGDAGFFGSTGAIALNQPMIGMAPTGTGRGYWLVAADGGVFTFGDAPYMGAVGRDVGQSVVGIARHPGT